MDEELMKAIKDITRELTKISTLMLLIHLFMITANILKFQIYKMMMMNQ